MLEDFWSRIRKTELPVVLYGTGDAADKLIEHLGRIGVRICGVFASSSFVRNRTFHSFRVLSYADARRIWGRMAVVMGFGTHDRETIGNIREIASENEFYCPCLLLDGNGLPFSGHYYSEHRKDYDRARNLLTDERSRRVYDAIISFRLTGDISYLLPVEEDEKESWSNIHFTSDETFVDIGAYDGDTVERFLEMTDGRYREIVAFEPDGRSFRKAQKRLAGKERVTLLNALLSDRVESVPFSRGEGRGNTRMMEGEERTTATLDISLVGKRPTLLKFDAEGDEEKILEGGRMVIGKYRPRLILSVYHRIDDFWRLPDKVLNLNSGYTKFTLRAAHAIPDWDIILLVE